jgi:peptide/nickel transport system substrate-binding protein
VRRRSVLNARSHPGTTLVPYATLSGAGLTGVLVSSQGERFVHHSLDPEGLAPEGLSSRRRRSTMVRLLGVVALAGLVAGACSSANDNGASNGEQGVGATDFTIAPEGEPRQGGSLIYGLEAETDGFNPTGNRWAVAGHMVAQAVFDSLTALDVDAQPQPYLAESVEPNDDYTTWTITLREGVTFHDGTPVNAAAVKATLEGHKASALTGSAVTPITSITVVDELTAEVNMSQPWAAFPAALTSQVGYVVAPVMLADATKADASRAPVGSGPFKFVEWTPGTRFVADRNENYWQDGLPYLDRVEFRPITQVRSRYNSLQTGEIQMMHTTDPTVISELRIAGEAGDLQLVEDRGEGEESFVLLNLDSAPLDDLRIRQALAYATDTETYNEVINGGVSVIANSMFKPDSPWRVETDYPSFDLDQAKALVEEYKADTGATEVRFRLSTTPTPETQRSVQILQEQWSAAGITVDINTVDQAAFITTAIASDYDANLWRQYGAPDPDVDLVWWYSQGPTAGSPNILNFPNMFDDQIDDALQRGRQSSALEDRRAAYSDFQKRFNEIIPAIWLNHTLWAVAATTNVRGIGNGVLPDGQEAYPLGGVGTFGGVHRLTQTWLAN